MWPSTGKWQRRLPAIQTLVFLGLYSLNFTLTESYATIRARNEGWDLRTSHPQPTRVEELLYLLNGPAVVGLPMEEEDRAHPVAFALTLVTRGGTVFLFWFWIGSLIDGRRSIKAYSLELYSRMARTVISALALCVCGLLFWWGIEAWGVWWEPRYIPQILGLWGLVGGIFILRSLLRWTRAPANKQDNS